MEVPDNLLCLFNAELEKQDEKYIIEIPHREVSKGQVQVDEMYRAGIIQNQTAESEEQPENEAQLAPEPPVTEDESRVVDIEDIGEQGDGIARVERGYVIIVPEAEPGERVEIKVGTVRENVAFGEVLERKGYYE